MPSEQVPSNELLRTLKYLVRHYVGILEHGRNRILDLGGQCDPVDVMERSDPHLRIVREIIAKHEAASSHDPFDDPFQDRVHKWMQATFDAETVANKSERNHRFLEESLELVQSLGCTQSEAHMLVDYVFGRPVGECEQETGGVMVTLAALANASNIRVNRAAENELARCWTKIEQIRAKQAAKPKHSPLPGPTPEPPAVPSVEPIARVINNNQPGWTNIVETAPNVTLDVGAPLYSREDMMRLTAALAGAIHRAEATQRAVDDFCSAQPPPESLCPNCEKDEVGTFTADEWFLYGVEKQFRLVAKDVLFFRCMACGLEFTGEDGEQKRLQAVRDHLERTALTKESAP